jgi:hypothetical protein
MKRAHPKKKLSESGLKYFGSELEVGYIKAI